MQNSSDLSLFLNTLNISLTDLSFRLIAERNDLKTSGAKPIVLNKQSSAGIVSIETLMEYNKKGYAIYWQPQVYTGVNETYENLQHVRFLVLDFDDGDIIGIEKAKRTKEFGACLIVETSPHKYQAIWKIENGKIENDADLQAWKTLFTDLSQCFKSDHAAAKLTQVFRIPGFLWQKNESAYMSRVVYADEDAKKVQYDTIKAIISQTKDTSIDKIPINSINYEAVNTLQCGIVLENESTEDCKDGEISAAKEASESRETCEALEATGTDLIPIGIRHDTLLKMLIRHLNNTESDRNEQKLTEYTKELVRERFEAGEAWLNSDWLDIGRIIKDAFKYYGKNLVKDLVKTEREIEILADISDEDTKAVLGFEISLDKCLEYTETAVAHSIVRQLGEFLIRVKETKEFKLWNKDTKRWVGQPIGGTGVSGEGDIGTLSSDLAIITADYISRMIRTKRFIRLAGATQNQDKPWNKLKALAAQKEWESAGRIRNIINMCATSNEIKTVSQWQFDWSLEGEKNEIVCGNEPSKRVVINMLNGTVRDVLPSDYALAGLNCSLPDRIIEKKNAGNGNTGNGNTGNGNTGNGNTGNGNTGNGNTGIDTDTTSISLTYSCPRWLQFLADIFDDNNDPEALIKFIQRLFGYSLSMHINEQKIFIHFGAGANGKSKVLDMLSAIVGHQYLGRLNSQDFVRINKKQATDVERIHIKAKGCRLSIIDDCDVVGSWSEGLVKNLTSKVACGRSLYKETEMIHNHCKYHMGCNDLPIPESENFGMLRRLVIIPYKRTFEPDGAAELRLQQMIEEEQSEVLLWALEGYRYWREHGLQIPDECKEALIKYQSNNFSSMATIQALYEPIEVTEVDDNIETEGRTIESIERELGDLIAYLEDPLNPENVFTSKLKAIKSLAHAEIIQRSVQAAWPHVGSKVIKHGHDRKRFKVYALRPLFRMSRRNKIAVKKQVPKETLELY